MAEYNNDADAQELVFLVEAIVSLQEAVVNLATAMGADVPLEIRSTVAKAVMESMKATQKVIAARIERDPPEG